MKRSHTIDLIAIYADMARLQYKQAKSHRINGLSSGVAYDRAAAEYAAISRALLFALINGEIKI